MWVRPCTAVPLFFGMATDLPPHRLGIVQTDLGPASMQALLWGAAIMDTHKNTITHRLPPRTWGNFAVVVSRSVWYVANAQPGDLLTLLEIQAGRANRCHGSSLGADAFKISAGSMGNGSFPRRCERARES
ncbi:MAG: hypothetical protein ACI9W2_000962 [Gammaproteobacteria bacterium]|jgi:hypothetical protein